MEKNKRDINIWPYSGNDGMTQNYKNKLNVWVECTKQHYWSQLECLPPIRQKQDVFMVGECYTSDKNGAIYACFVEITFEGEKSARYFGKLCPIKTFDPVLYKMEIIDQILK